MHVLQRKSFHAVLLMSLGWMGCDLLPGEEDKDTMPPTNVRVTGGVSAGESVSGQRTLQATAEDDSGKVAKVEFYVSNVLACTDAEPRDSGATFSCVWDASTLSEGSAQLIAKAHDAAGNTTSSEAISFTVAPPNNHAPTLSSPVSATPSSLNERASTTLTVTASDVDGDTLTYSWTQTPAAPAGTFGPETGATRTWTAPAIQSNTTFTLEVTVSDGKGGMASSTVDVAVAVDLSATSYAAHIQPIWNATCVNCHSTSGRGGLNLTEGNSHASLINVNAAGTPCGPTGLKRVVPNQPDNSLLVLKLGPTPPCGARMPTTDTTYFDRNPGLVTRIRAWILAGAPNN